MTGDEYQNGFDTNFSQSGGYQNSTVYTVGLRIVQRLIQQAHMLREDALSFSGSGRDIAVTNVSSDQCIPDGIDLADHFLLVTRLISRVRIDDSDVERFSEQLVQIRVLFVHIRSESQAGVQNRFAFHHQIRTVVDGPQHYGCRLFRWSIAANLHFEGHRNRRCLSDFR